VIYSPLPRHAAIAGIAIALSVSSVLAAQALAAPALAAQTPAQQDLLPENAAGSYLAARHAGAERDAGAAATYYLNVLKLDPRNPDLLSRAFLSVLTDGDVDGAGKLADRVLAADRTDRIARLVIGIRELKQKRYGQAQQDFAQSVRGPVTDLAAALLSGWAAYGAGDSKAATDTIDKLSGPDWYMAAFCRVPPARTTR